MLWAELCVPASPAEYLYYILSSCPASRAGSEPTVPGTGRSVQIFLPVWNRFSCCSEHTWATSPHSGTCMGQRGCCSSVLSADVISGVFNNLKHLLGLWSSPCAVVPGCGECWDICPSWLIPWSLCLSPESLYLAEESQPPLLLSVVPFPCFICVFCPLSAGTGAEMCFFIPKGRLTDAAFQHRILKLQRWFM